MGGWPSGVFWTTAAPAESMGLDMDRGEAYYSAVDLDIPDYINSLNALANGPTLPGKVSFDLRWFRNPTSRRWIYNHPADSSEPDSYALDYWDTAATLEWEATTGDFSFTSYKIGNYPPSRSPGQFFAVAGRERSGALYQPWAAGGGTAPSPAPSTNDPPTRPLAATGGGGRSLGLGMSSLVLGVSALVALRRRPRLADPAGPTGGSLP